MLDIAWFIVLVNKFCLATCHKLKFQIAASTLFILCLSSQFYVIEHGTKRYDDFQRNIHCIESIFYKHNLSILVFIRLKRIEYKKGDMCVPFFDIRSLEKKNLEGFTPSLYVCLCLMRLFSKKILFLFIKHHFTFLV